jgi:hypothetical protein
MRSKTKNKRSKKFKGQDEDMEDAETEDDPANVQTTETQTLERAVRSTPFSANIWAARIMVAVSLSSYFSTACS